MGGVAEEGTVKRHIVTTLHRFPIGDSRFTTIWTRLVALTIGGVFIYAGVLKALDPVQFARDIDNYKILPWSLGVRLAFFLPWLEILCGGALVVRRLYPGAILLLSALAAVFIGATIAAKARGLDITCGCFGHISQHWSFTRHMFFDLIIFAALVALWRSARKVPAS